MLSEEIQSRLLSLADTDYRDFSSALIPNCENMLGVRLPQLRAIAKEIAKSDCVQEFLNKNKFEYFEEKMLQGMVIGYLQTPFDKHLDLVKNFVPKIDSWSVCDSFVCGLKFFKKDKIAVWNFLQKYLASKDEFELRFGVVSLMDYFCDEEWFERAIDKLLTLYSEFYYAQMGIAWAISVFLAKFYDRTFTKLLDKTPSEVILKRSVQKACESLRLTKEQKQKLRETFCKLY